MSVEPEGRPPAFEEWVVRAAAELAADNSLLRDPGQAGTFSEAAAYLLSAKALAPNLEGLPSVGGEAFNGYEILLVGLFSAAYPMVMDNTVRLLIYVDPGEDIDDHQGGRQDEEKANVAGLLPGKERDRAIFSALDVPLRGFACGSLADLECLYELLLSASRRV